MEEEFIKVDAVELPKGFQLGQRTNNFTYKNNDQPRFSTNQRGKYGKQKNHYGKYKISDFTRGMKLDTRNIENQRLRNSSSYRKQQVYQAAQRARLNQKWMVEDSAGFIQTEGVERTYQLRQQDIVANAPVGVACNAFDLRLEDLGPYTMSYTSNGQKMLLGGSKGHLAFIDWKTKTPICEVTEVQDRVHCVCSLHNDLLFAAAQSECVFIYNNEGQEVHRMQEHNRPLFLEFLPHHFLLTSCSRYGSLAWQDISHGEIAKITKTKLMPTSYCQDPTTGVVCVGDVRGTVSLWTPNMPNFGMKMLVHRGEVKGLKIDNSGRYMVTAGLEGRMYIWDIRHTKANIFEYKTYGSISSISISQAGEMIATARAKEIKIWKNTFSQQQDKPYLVHKIAPPMGLATQVEFCPYEDALGVGCEFGVSSLLVPGSGIASYDVFVADPFETKKQRQEREVRALLDKLPPASIILDPNVFGKILREPEEVQEEKQAEEEAANRLAREQQLSRTLARKKMKGRNKPTKKAAKKQMFLYKEMVLKLRKELKRRRELRKQQEDMQTRQEEEQQKYQDKKKKNVDLDAVPLALQAFYK